jgi:hypothetical protein
MTHTHTHTQSVESPGRSTAPLRDLCLYRTQHSQETDIHAPDGIRTLNPSKRVQQTYAVDHAATGIDRVLLEKLKFLQLVKLFLTLYRPKIFIIMLTRILVNKPEAL